MGFLFSFFWGARVADFSWFWVPADPILASIFLYFESSGPLGKQLKVLQWLSISEVWPLPDWVFLQVWLWVRFGDVFVHFFMIFNCLEALILRAFGFNRCQKGGPKKRHKKGVKRGLRARRCKLTVGLWVPLRTRKQDIRTSENQKTDKANKTRQKSLKKRRRSK